VPGAIKQSAGITYEAAEEDVVTVATWTKVNRQDVDDIDGFQADVGQALSYGLSVEVEAMLMQAITGATGILAPDVTGEANAIDAAVTAVAELRATGVAPLFVAWNPLDIADWSKLKTGAGGEYLFG